MNIADLIQTAGAAVFIKGRVKLGVLRPNRRQVAASHPRYPILGIGRGYDPDAPDEDDHAGRCDLVCQEPGRLPGPESEGRSRDCLRTGN